MYVMYADGSMMRKKGFPEASIAPGTKWEDVPEDFVCPLCFVGKEQFSEV